MSKNSSLILACTFGIKSECVCLFDVNEADLVQAPIEDGKDQGGEDKNVITKARRISTCNSIVRDICASPDVISGMDLLVCGTYKCTILIFDPISEKLLRT